MPTTVVKTIGSGGDYSTLQAWEDASPANLVTSDQVWEGQIISAATAFTTPAEILIFAGGTTDSTRYKHLTTAAGASFIDHATVQSNELRFNASNGASISCADNYSSGIKVEDNYTRLSKLQIAGSNGNSSRSTVLSPATNLWIEKCLIEGTVGPVVTMNGANCKMTNTLVVKRAAGDNIVSGQTSLSLWNCTLVKPSDLGAVTDGLKITYASGTSTTQNCAIFGATNAAVSNGTLTHTNGRTDDASPPTGFTQITYNTTTGSGFQNITDATRDFRIKDTSAMVDVGTTDSTNAATDIVGTARPEGSAYDIGAWEYKSASGPVTVGATGSAVTPGDGIAVPGTSIGL